MDSNDLLRAGTELLTHHGLSAEDAHTVAYCLVESDLRGVSTHGIVRLPHYLNRVRLGLINAKPNVTTTNVTPVAALVDGDDGFGFVVATNALRTAMDAAETYGIGMAGVKNSSHFGMAASYVLQAVRAGYICMVFTNASKGMPPWGGRDPVLGTSPFAAGAPAGDQPPFVLDMSGAVAARGKVRLAALRGETVPEGWGLNSEGASTTDPQEILDGGVVLPVGGPKGSALAMMMDIFSGVFTGSAFAGDVTNHTVDFEKPQNVGHFLLAIKPGLFMSTDDFLSRMDVLVSRVKSSSPAVGFTEVLMPGEFESRLTEERSAHGVPIPAAEFDNLASACAAAGVAAPISQAVPF
ncbi:Ldh family oxidoreductase [Rhodococcus opacus]|uniref:Ldh family oxidoreductase n=1 Tax=Rhodococcus opacus TaxID=37919 RepID=UPI0024731C73|nr:Ldh family oxidoreductase [Rhodococcus opacus]